MLHSLSLVDWSLWSQGSISVIGSLLFYHCRQHASLLQCFLQPGAVLPWSSAFLPVLWWTVGVEVGCVPDCHVSHHHTELLISFWWTAPSTQPQRGYWKVIVWPSLISTLDLQQLTIWRVFSSFKFTGPQKLLDQNLNILIGRFDRMFQNLLAACTWPAELNTL